ncbi:Uncharacterized membrane protein YesL [Gracilibacillus orientalis]|uniref:Uncharacterized membrane protein YesL n=1 Tax=Gracilibacillus orientalis TaxID=334253 RepID=A0A1I4LIE5_9BACI|nr:DUF624 domain-containing protein [Gracilibacillus orientalis]SFL90804.1 Uncharacterized membrane protein YesL [Gracilibacillus orientalis]
MELDGLAGKVYKVTDWLMTIVVTNLLWFIFNIPIAYLTFMLLVVDDMREIIAFSLYILILVPLLFFPATTAMFAVIRHKIMFSKNDVSIFKLFIKNWKVNFVRSMLGGSIFALLWVILVVDYFFFVNRINENFVYLFMLIGFFLVVMTLHFFSVTVHVHTKLLQAIKNAMIISLINPLLTLIIGVVSLAVIYCSFQVTTFLIPFFVGSLIVYVSFYGFYRFFTKMIDTTMPITSEKG